MPGGELAAMVRMLYWNKMLTPLFRWMSTSLVLLALVLAGCLGPPPSLSGSFSDVSVAQAKQDDLTGGRIRWGGTIIETRVRREDTCFDVLSRPLDHEAVPRHDSHPDGRFKACAPGFYDPGLYAKGRDITVVGSMQGTERGRMDEQEHRYPTVAAEAVHLWPERVPPPPPIPYPDLSYALWPPWRYDPWYSSWGWPSSW